MSSTELSPFRSGLVCHQVHSQHIFAIAELRLTLREFDATTFASTRRVFALSRQQRQYLIPVRQYELPAGAGDDASRHGNTKLLQ